MDILVKRIKELRSKFGLTQQQLAYETGLSVAGIQSIETGRAKPNVETLVKLADRFNCTTDYLLGRDIESIEEKRKKLRQVADSVNEFIQFVQENEGETPPPTLVNAYINSLTIYLFEQSAKPIAFLNDPMAHTQFMMKMINDEFEKLDKMEKENK